MEEADVKETVRRIADIKRTNSLDVMPYCFILVYRPFGLLRALLTLYRKLA